MDDVKDRVLGYTKLLAEGEKCFRAISGAYLKNLRFSKPCRRIESALPIAFARTTLGMHIGNVVYGGTKKQVVRSDATGIVAVMADEQSPVERAIGNFIGEPMRVDYTGLRVKTTVTFGVSGACPQPAGLGLANILPKAFFDGHSTLDPTILAGS